MKRIIRIALVCCLVILAVLALCADAAAQLGFAPSEMSAEVTGWLALIPQLRTVAAPDWLKPGMRLTYIISSASRQGDTTPAGQSVVHYDFLSVDASGVVAALGASVISGGSIMTLREAGFTVGAPGAGEVWLHPSVLPGAQAYANPHLTVTRTQMNIGGKAVPAVRFGATGDGSTSTRTFDEATGMLLFSMYTLGDFDTAKQANTMAEFVSARQKQAAWAGGSLPGWAQVGTKLVYDGYHSANVGYGSPAIPVSLRTVMSIVRLGSTYAIVKSENFVNGVSSGQSFGVASALMPTDSVFLPPEALRTLKPGQVLDQDPFTGVVVAVSQQPVYLDGKALLTITYQGRSFRRVYAYDTGTGMLTYMGQTSTESIAVTTIELRLAGVYKD